MNWVKDNLILVLGVACLVFALGWTIDHLVQTRRIAGHKTAYATLDGQYKAAQQVNLEEVAKLKALQARFNTLVEAQALDRKNAERAAAQVAEYKARLDAQLESNQKLREQLARDRPDVKKYLDSAAMPHDLACSLWPDEPHCR